MFKTAKNFFQNQIMVFWTLVFLVVLVLVLYIFFINQTVANTAERSLAEKGIAQLNQELGSLEFRYISLKNDIDIERAHSFGFRPIEPQFIQRRSLGQAVLSPSI